MEGEEIEEDDAGKVLDAQRFVFVERAGK